MALVGDAVVLAVADGAGSRPQSLLGATAAVETAVSTVAAALRTAERPLVAGGDSGSGPEPGSRVVAGAPRDPESLAALLRSALAKAREAVERTAADCDLNVDALSSTLVVAVAAGALVGAAQIGDGAAVFIDHEARLVTLTSRRHHEYANETEFLTGPDALESASIVVLPEAARALALISDGAQPLAIRALRGEPALAFFAPLTQFAAAAEDETVASSELGAFLAGPRVRERTDDDVTVLVAAHPAPVDTP